MRTRARFPHPLFPLRKPSMTNVSDYLQCKWGVISYCSAALLQELAKAGLKTPSPVQCQVWPTLLNGNFLTVFNYIYINPLLIAQVSIRLESRRQAVARLWLSFFPHSSISTSSSSIPDYWLICNINQCTRLYGPHEKQPCPSVLVLTPTRELAQQIKREVDKYSYNGYKRSYTSIFTTFSFLPFWNEFRNISIPFIDWMWLQCVFVWRRFSRQSGQRVHRWSSYQWDSLGWFTIHCPSFSHCNSRSSGRSGHGGSRPAEYCLLRRPRWGTVH